MRQGMGLIVSPIYRASRHIHRCLFGGYRAPTFLQGARLSLRCNTWGVAHMSSACAPRQSTTVLVPVRTGNIPSA